MVRGIGRRAGLMLCVAATLVACGGTTAAPLPTTSARGFPLGDLTVRRGGHDLLHLTVEIADNQAAWEHGLMGVKSLAADRGMAFVFPQAVGDGFWMKDTLIPLDIAFVDPQGRVVDVQNMVPCTADPCQVYYAAAMYSMSLETGSGVLTRAGVRKDDVITLAWRAPRHSPSPATSSGG